jgi:Flp pilus assembly pilin Flp
MKYDNILKRAVIPGLIAAAAILLFLRTQANADAVIGFVSVAIIAGVVAMEYRLNWKWLVKR